MEENKYICPKCGSEMSMFYDKPALNLVCPKCGCQIATTKWDDIDLDDTDYKIILNQISNPSIEVIKAISKITGHNFISAKTMLLNGDVLVSAKATEIKEKSDYLKKINIQFIIEPFFPY